MKESSVFTSVKRKPVFGIDLGTTNSCIAIIKKGNNPEIIPLKNGRSTMPSCVMYNQDGTVIVGEEAYVQRHRTNVVYSVKRLMGSRTKIQVSEPGWAKSVTPVEVSAEILKALVENINDRYVSVEDVVITVPADFNTIQIEDTLNAAKLAGLNVLQVLTEPTAAALALAIDEKDTKDIMVYDFGGGTFDVSLINITQTSEEENEDLNSLYGFETESKPKGDSVDKSKAFVVKSTRGDSNLGGDDLDKILLDIVLDKAKAQGIPVHRMSKIAKEKLKYTLEQLKKTGVDRKYSVVVEVDYSTSSAKKVTKRTTVNIDIDDFYKATEEVYLRTYKFIEQLLKGYKGKIDAIVTVGGSTKNPLIQELLKQTFSVPVYSGLNPDESVALGASVHAKNLAYGDGNISIMDVISNGIGVVSDNRVSNIIPRDSSIPCSFTRMFTTTFDDQDEVHVDVYSGNSSLKQECDYVGTLIFDDIPKGKAGTVGVNVRLSVDSNGVLYCGVITSNGVKTVKVKNILGEGTPKGKVTINGKKVGRWRGLVENLEPSEDRDLLENLINKFENTNSKETEQEIIALIRKLKDNIVAVPLIQNQRTGINAVHEALNSDKDLVGEIMSDEVLEELNNA